MACASCAAKNQSRTNLYAFQNKKRLSKLSSLSSKPCKYTFEQISERLEIETNIRHKKYLQNALKNYSKNCNLFNRQLDKVFV